MEMQVASERAGGKPLWHLFALSNGASLTPAYARSYYGRDPNFVPLRAAGGTEGAAKQAGRASYEEALPPLPSLLLPSL